MNQPFRIGSAYDVHRLEKGGYIVLAGIKIPCRYKTIAHSDGDVVFHALGEAFLGSLALGDLGKFFPPNDDKFLNMDSKDIILFVKEKLHEYNYSILNLDVSIILETPKLKDYILDMRKNTAEILELDMDQVSIKAGTNENLDSIGGSSGIAAFANVLIFKNK